MIDLLKVLARSTSGVAPATVTVDIVTPLNHQGKNCDEIVYQQEAHVTIDGVVLELSYRDLLLLWEACGLALGKFDMERLGIWRG